MNATTSAPNQSAGPSKDPRSVHIAGSPPSHPFSIAGRTSANPRTTARHDDTSGLPTGGPVTESRNAGAHFGRPTTASDGGATVATGVGVGVGVGAGVGAAVATSAVGSGSSFDLVGRKRGSPEHAASVRGSSVSPRRTFVRMADESVDQASDGRSITMARGGGPGTGATLEGMSSRSVSFDPDNPRAPSEAAWAQMSDAEREAAVDALPIDVPEELSPPEGDDHREAKTTLLDDLGQYFKKRGQRIYLSSEINVYYPAEDRFAPDFLAVLDADARRRNKWVVSAEGKGLDLALEVAVSSHTKDLRVNVERYARLGIPEYFVFDRIAVRLHGFRLPPKKAGGDRPSYERIVPQGGRFTSSVLGLELGLEGERLRFYHATATVLGTAELLERATSLIDEVQDRYAAYEREIAEARAEAERKTTEIEQKIAEIEHERAARKAVEEELAALRAELARRDES